MSKNGQQVQDMGVKKSSTPIGGGDPRRTRTYNQLIKSQLLYH